MPTLCLFPRPTGPVLPMLMSSARERRLAVNARTELAARLHIPAPALMLERIEDTTFTDTSFGFPERDGCYGPAMLDGHVVRFAYMGRHYEFHGISDDIESGAFGEVPDKGTPLYWMRDARGIFVPDPQP